MSKGVSFTVYGMKIEAKLRDLGGQRVTVEGFYVDGVRTVPHSNFRQETFKQLAAAIQRQWPGRWELVNAWPTLK